MDLMDAKLMKRLDGWTNVLTGLGMKNRDKKKATKSTYEQPEQHELEDLYAASDIAETLVDTLPDDMIRKGFKMTQGDDADENFDKDVQDRFRDLQVMEKLLTAMQWGRLYGGSVALIGVNDGKRPEDPLELGSVKEISWIQPFNRFELTVHEVQNDPSKPNFRMPEYYMLTSSTSSTNSAGDYAGNPKIHYTRVLPFHGSKLPWEIYRSNSYWHDSVLTKTKEVISSYESAFESASTFMHEFSQGVFKIKNLAKLIANGNDEQVMKRLELVDMKRSVVRSIVIDADGEDFHREVPNLSGVAPLLEKMEKRMTAAAKMPHTKLLGEGAAGTLGGGGESENKDWYDRVAREQKKVLQPALERILEIMFAAKQEKVNEPKTWDIEFNSLWEMSDVQKSDVRLKTAQTDQIYYTMGAVTEDEIALSRFGSGKYSTETQLILDRDPENQEDKDEIENKEPPKVEDEP